MKSPSPQVCITVDVERDCPPYFDTFRGVEEGMPPLLELLKREGVPATFFVSGEVANRYPHVVLEILSHGHEVGSHGLTHSRLTSMEEEEARVEIQGSREILLRFGPVRSFRAPNLSLPGRFLKMVEEAGFLTDSSQARYKTSRCGEAQPTSLKRVPVSVTSSVLRLPRWIRNPWLRSLSSPVVLFVHPWEFVDWRKARLRLDCRFRTGAAALGCLRSTLGIFKKRDARFLKIGDL